MCKSYVICEDCGLIAKAELRQDCGWGYIFYYCCGVGHNCSPLDTRTLSEACYELLNREEALCDTCVPTAIEDFNNEEGEQ